MTKAKKVDALQAVERANAEWARGVALGKGATVGDTTDALRKCMRIIDRLAPKPTAVGVLVDKMREQGMDELAAEMLLAIDEDRS